ncbi:hypothetical protein J2T19_003895 [Paenibacillus tundrae]|uniref:Uncharacterized protein n=2 Tax=Paenibacillus tundrae TaxID=528187 RepID=A0ABT9WGM7_9BACL|nr:hypothetical protein [Paenibacillus tundrae]
MDLNVYLDGKKGGELGESGFVRVQGRIRLEHDVVTGHPCGCELVAGGGKWSACDSLAVAT